jgi:hypothetical protein
MLMDHYPSVFRTSHTTVSTNETSSYVDLSPLYGVSDKDHDKVRVKSGLGLLHPDVFAEDRLLLLPPAVCVLLVLFNRNHNVSKIIYPLKTIVQLILFPVYRQEDL